MTPEEERWLEAGLEEVLGGARPPDLRERILERAATAEDEDLVAPVGRGGADFPGPAGPRDPSAPERCAPPAPAWRPEPAAPPARAEPLAVPVGAEQNGEAATAPSPRRRPHDPHDLRDAPASAAGAAAEAAQGDAPAGAAPVGAKAAQGDAPASAAGAAAEAAQGDAPAGAVPVGAEAAEEAVAAAGSPGDGPGALPEGLRIAVLATRKIPDEGSSGREGGVAPVRLRRPWRAHPARVVLFLGVASLGALGTAALVREHRLSRKLERARVEEERALAQAAALLRDARRALRASKSALLRGSRAEALDALRRARQGLHRLDGACAARGSVLATVGAPSARLGVLCDLQRLRVEALLPGFPDPGQEAGAARASFARDAAKTLALIKETASDDPDLAATVAATEGEVQRALGEFVRARDTFRDAVERDPRDGWARLGLARAALALEDFETAVVSYSAAATRFREELGGRGGAGSTLEAVLRAVARERLRARVGLRQFVGARQEALARRKAGDGWRARLLLARAHEASGRVLSADAELAAAADEAPEEAAVWRTQGELWLRRGEGERAAQALRRALSVAPRDERSLLLLARCQLERGAFDAAEEWLAQAAEAIPAADWRGRAHLLAEQARLAWLRSDVDRARALLTEARNLLPDAVGLRLLQLEFELDPLLAFSRSSTSARRQVEEALAATPWLWRVRRALAAANANEGRADRGDVDALERCLEEAPGDVETLAVLGAVQRARVRREPRRARHLREASAEAFRRARHAALDPGQPVGRALLAGRREEALLGERPAAGPGLDRAEAFYRVALLHAPRCVPASLGLARLALARGSFGEAHAHLRRARAVDPQDPGGILLAARLLLENPALGQSARDMADVRSLLRDARDLEPFELRLLAAMQAVWTAARKGEDAALAASEEAFAPLRTERPGSPWVLRAQAGALEAVRARFRFGGRVAARCGALREAASELEGAAASGRARSARSCEEAEAALRAGALPAARAACASALRAFPNDPRAWRLLARVEEQAGRPWAALAAASRAAWHDARACEDLARSLRALQRTPRLVGAAGDGLALPAGVRGDGERERVVAALPTVARAFVGEKVPRADAKEVFELLEALGERRPERLAPVALAGLLALGVERWRYASMQLGVFADERLGRSELQRALALATARAGQRDERVQARCLRALVWLRTNARGDYAACAGDPAVERLLHLPAFRRALQD
ncbi:MAG: hypothetical protein D6731_21575 [Planctomycetota bacterium]|nr:MAG: hypothetical protein D6731_21575 [Planctomycetota bacterium]